MISHGNYRSMVTMSLDESVLERDSTTYLFLPLAHSFALLIQLLSFDLGGNIAYWERDPLKIVPNLSEVKPDYFPSVPRIFEKIYTAATGNVEKEGGLKKLVFNWAIGVGKKVRERERAGKPIGWLLRRQYEIADKQVLSKISALFGGKIKNCVTGAAPINPEILRFFDAAGVLVLEGWGMTETSTAATVARPDAFKFGTVGRAFKDAEIRIADDGEILVTGPQRLPGLLQEPGGDEGDDRRRLAAHRRHRRDRLRGLPEDHRPQEGHHHHRRRQEHHARQPRGRDQAAPVGLSVRRGRRSPPVPDRARHPRPRGGREARRGEGLADRPCGDRAQSGDAGADPGAPRRRSTRSSPASSR